jgi:hypothetical protein
MPGDNRGSKMASRARCNLRHVVAVRSKLSTWGCCRCEKCMTCEDACRCPLEGHAKGTSPDRASAVRTQIGHRSVTSLYFTYLRSLFQTLSETDFTNRNNYD